MWFSIENLFGLISGGFLVGRNSKKSDVLRYGRIYNMRYKASLNMWNVNIEVYLLVRPRELQNSTNVGKLRRHW